MSDSFSQVSQEDLQKTPVINTVNNMLAARVAEVNDSHLTKFQAIKKYPYAFFCIIIMVWTLVCASFESQAGGIVISIEQFRKHFGKEYDGSYVIEAKWQSAFSGVPLAAQIVGQWFSSELCDKFGKKWVILGSCLCSVSFIGMEFAATHINLFLAGKTMNGLCFGLIQPAAVSYVSDISPLILRGTATTMCNIAFSLGPLVYFIINYSLSSKGEDDPWAYRALFAAQWGFAVVAICLLLLVPESPTFHIIQGNIEKAKRSYKKLLKDDVAVDEQVNIVQMTVEQAKTISKNTSYLDLFKGLNLKRTLVSMFLFIVQPMSGVYFTANYTAYYFQLSGYDAAKSFRFICGAQTISLVGCIMSLFLVDLAGYRSCYVDRYGLHHWWMWYFHNK
jgi:MFS family permease